VSSDRYVVLGLAQVRAAWFREVSHWSTAAMVPIEFVKCVSVDELRARLAAGRAFSAVLVDAAVAGVDRDLIELAREAGCAVIAVADGHAPRDLVALGAAAVLPAPFDRTLLLAVLSEHCTMIGDAAARAAAPPGADRAGPQAWRGTVIAVTGAGGSGSSTVAMALAQGLSNDVRARGRVLLADFALDADQAMLHDARDVVPGVQELVEAFRHGSPGPEELVHLTFGDEHAYRLLLGLRRHRDWTALRPRAFHAAFDGLRRTFTHVVCDIDPDLEGEAESGSFDVEERNLMARSAVDAAAITIVTGTASVQGTHRLVLLVARLVEHGVPVERILPVINRAPRSGRARAEIARTVADLVAPLIGTAVSSFTSPLFLPEQRRLDQSVRDGLGAPPAMATALAATVFALLQRETATATIDLTDAEPVRITPGSLGSWAANEAAG
jgi:hypothetical protein